jgi:hypothetical protein
LREIGSLFDGYRPEVNAKLADFLDISRKVAKTQRRTPQSNGERRNTHPEAES